ncbi:hypothetical protein DFS34DRAFT_645332 [Phlyctochytrium arcticum]|nr:hypothetical protein DFS34DRAFT_645332 [Phlyctochytrium arcticum]
MLLRSGASSIRTTICSSPTRHVGNAAIRGWTSRRFAHDTLRTRPKPFPQSTNATPGWRPPTAITQDIVLYRNPDQSQYRVAYFCAGGQMLMWLTFADWCWRELRTSTTDPETGREEYVLAPRGARTAAAAFCLSIGGLFAGAVHLWSHRRVRALTLIKGGKYVGIDTSNLLGRNRVIIETLKLKTWEKVHRPGESPADRWKNAKMSTFTKVSGHRAYVILKPTTIRTGYMVDRSGEFLEPELFDYLFYKPT